MIDVAYHRTLLLFVPLLLTTLLFLWHRPSSRVATAGLFSFLWQLPALLLLQILATHFGWWNFTTDSNLLLGMPVDVWIGWALWWGPVLLLAAPKINLFFVMAFTAWIDVLAMPLLVPLLHLGSDWLWGELLALTIVLVPGQLLGRWTINEKALAGRTYLLVLCFIGIAFWLLPTIILTHTSADWSLLLSSNDWFRSIMILLIAVPSVMGLSAVYEFYLRGNGTPIPLDPPKNLVTTGPYAYLANPMQVSAALVWLLLGIWLQSIWVAASAGMAVIFGLGLADWEERTALKKRMGPPWTAYRNKVKTWLPRWRPVGMPAAEVYIAERCGPCEQLAFWLKCQEPIQLKIIPAQQHPHRDLVWITYRLENDPIEEEGIVAIARVLEHIHLGWAWFGWMIRLPVINYIAQRLLELSFTKPLDICKRTTGENLPSKEIDKGNQQ